MAVLAFATVAHADPVPLDLSITGEIGYDNGFGLNDVGSYSFANGGGASGTLAYADGGGGGNISGSVVAEGGGFEIMGAGGFAGENDFEFGTGIDLSFSITNSSATDSYEIFFKVVHENSVTANGADAFAESLLDFVKEPGGVGIPDDTFVERDTLGVGDGTDTDNGMFTFSIIVGALGSFDLEGNWTMEGGQFDAFDADPGDAFGALSATITIDSIVNLTGPPPGVPEPSVWVLMGIGAVVCALRRRRTNR
ncbi:MAG: PEP-CTERM sorting domain-containing protein [Planctomycetota bacterium]|jgi:hypothetical protein